MRFDLPKLEERLGLHQRLEVIYVVDGFNAQLVNEDGYGGTIAEAHGVTILEALENLNEKLGGKRG